MHWTLKSVSVIFQYVLNRTTEMDKSDGKLFSPPFAYKHKCKNPKKLNGFVVVTEDFMSH